MIWRPGFDDWKAVEEVRKVAQQVFRPPPLKRASSPPPLPAVRESSVDADHALHFKDVKPELTGIGGWLGLLAFSQVTGILRLVVSLGQYYTTIDPQVTAKFPTAIWGEAAMNAVVVWFCAYTAVLLFRHSRNFPRFFIWQMIAVICMPIADLLWVAFMISLASGRPFADFLTLEAKEGGQIVAAVIGALIRIPYILRSRRAANTFTQ
jgi:hypothetical protein